MPTFKGTVRNNDLEGGFLELVTDAGDVFRLQGGPELSPGSRVEVEGKVETAGYGIHMSGPAIQVESAKCVD